QAIADCDSRWRLRELGTHGTFHFLVCRKSFTKVELGSQVHPSAFRGKRAGSDFLCCCSWWIFLTSNNVRKHESVWLRGARGAGGSLFRASRSKTQESGRNRSRDTSSRRGC